MTRSVGLVVPALNPDVPRLKRYLEELHETVDPDLIRIELDDPTGRVATELDGMDADCSIVNHRRGKGLAITHGFDALETEIFVFVDADGSTDATSVAQLVETIDAGRADVAVGSRRHPQSVVDGRSLDRGFMSGIFARVARLSTGIAIRDFQCGAKAFDAACWSDIRADLVIPGFGWDLEVIWLSSTRGYTVLEVPVVWSEKAGTTVNPFKTGIRLLDVLGQIAFARIRGRNQLGGPDERLPSMGGEGR